ncbi:MAG: hypothetical protein E7668_02300 [Ruminococcaceae bacterium]|nr:hypothetical protein [Oscillospiraceae bacterium]
MKHAVRFLTFFISVLLLASLLFCAVGASEATYLDQRRNALYELYTQYAQKLPNHSSEIYPSNAVWFYVDELAKLPANTSDEQVEVIYQQGVSAGILTWIYYRQPEEIRTNEEISTVYRNQWKKIDPNLSEWESDGYTTADKTDPDLSFFSVSSGTPAVESCYTALLKAIYTLKLNQLQLSTDLPDSEIPTIVFEALSQLEGKKYATDFLPYHDVVNVIYNTEDGYTKLYADTKTKVTDQRNREQVAEELRQVYLTLYEVASPDSFALADVAIDEGGAKTAIGLFLDSVMGTQEMPAMTSVSDMNRALGSAVQALLNELIESAEEADTYERAYLSSLRTKVGDETDHGSFPAQVTPLFANYDALLARAKAKDELTAYEQSLSLDGYSGAEGSARNALVTLYADPTATDKLLDVCSFEELQNTLKQAKDRLHWFDRSVKALNTVEDYVSGEDLSALSAELTLQYQNGDALLAKGQATLDQVTNGTATDPATGEPANTDFGKTIAKAEATAYRNDHPIFQNDASVKPNTEQSSLESALTDADKLSSAAQKVLAEELSALVDAYKAHMAEKITAAIPNDASEEAFNRIATDAEANLTERAEALSLDQASQTPYTDLIDAAKRLTDKATAVESLLKDYHEKLTDGSPSSHKSDMNAVAADGTAQILATESQNETALAEAAMIRLNRLDALEDIEQAAEGVNADGVAALLDEAEKTLKNGEGTPPSTDVEIAEYAQNTIFRIENCVTAEMLNGQIDDLLDRIHAMDEELSDQTNEKQPYLDRANALRDYAEDIRNAKAKATEQATVTQAKESFAEELAQLSHTLDQIEAAYEEYSNALKELSGLPNLSAEQQDGLESQVHTQYDTFLEEVAETHTKEQVNTALSDLKEDISNLLTEAGAKDLAQAQEKAKQEIGAQAEKLTDTINGYGYISDADKEALLSELEQIQSETEAALDAATDTDGVANAKKKGEEALTALAERANAEESDDCLSFVKETLQDSYTENDYSADRRLEIRDIIDECKEELERTKQVSEYETLLADALRKIDAVPNLLEEALTDGEARLTAAYEALLLRKNLYSAEKLQELHERYQTTLAALRAFSQVSDAPALIETADTGIAAMRAIPISRVYTEDGLFADSDTPFLPDGYAPGEMGYSGQVRAENGLPSDLTLSITCTTDSEIAKTLKAAAKAKKIYLPDGSVASAEVLKLLKNCYVSAAMNIRPSQELLSNTGAYEVSLLLPKTVDLSHVIGVVFVRADGSAEFYEITAEDWLIRFDATHFSDYYLVSESTVNLVPWIVLLCVIIFCEALALVLMSVRKARKQTELPLLNLMLPFTALTLYRPTGGIAILWLLGTIALLLGVWIALLVVAEVRAKRETEPQIEPEPIPEPETEPQPEPKPETEPLPEVTVAEAEVLMSDLEANEELREDTDGFVDTETYTGTKKAEINIDTISQTFPSGAVITLNSLKEKKLIPQSAGHVKILARGTLNKPLTVIAQDFSTAALKMILLTGGSAIVTEPSPQRGGKKLPNGK